MTIPVELVPLYLYLVSVELVTEGPVNVMLDSMIRELISLNLWNPSVEVHANTGKRAWQKKVCGK